MYEWRRARSLGDGKGTDMLIKNCHVGCPARRRFRRYSAVGTSAVILTLTLGAWGATTQAATTRLTPMTIRAGGDVVSSTPNGQSMTVFKDTVEKLSGDKIKVNIFPNGELGTSDAIFTSLQTGSIQVDWQGIGNIDSGDTQMDLLSLPFLFSSSSEMLAALKGKLGASLDKTWTQKTHTVVLGIQSFGAPAIETTTPITSLGSLKGLKFRTVPNTILDKTDQVVGIVPVALDTTKVASAMLTHLVQGIMLPLSFYEGYGINETAHYITLTPSVESGLYFQQEQVMANQKWYGDLAPADKKIIDEGIQKADAFANKAADTVDRQDLTKFEAEKNMHVSVMSKANIDAWKKLVMQKVYPIYTRQWGSSLVDLAERDAKAS